MVIHSFPQHIPLSQKEKLESLLAELEPLDENNCTYREYTVALALKGVISDCLDRVSRKRVFDGAL